MGGRTIPADLPVDCALERIGGILIAVLLVFYGQTVAFTLVSWDDGRYVVQTARAQSERVGAAQEAQGHRR